MSISDKQHFLNEAFRELRCLKDAPEQDPKMPADEYERRRAYVVKCLQRIKQPEV